MRPFNLQAALSGKPVITRDGRKVSELHYFKTVKSIYPVSAVIGGNLEEFTKDGRYSKLEECPEDLFMAAEKVTKWVNVYAGSYIAHIYDTEDMAKAHASKPCIATVPITFEV